MAIQVNTSPKGLSIKIASKPNNVNASVPSQDTTLGRELRAGEVHITATASPLKLKAYNQENGLASSCGEALKTVCGDHWPSVNCQGKLTCQNRMLIHVNNAPAAAASQVYETPGRARRRATTTEMERNNKTNVISTAMDTYFTA
jgi:hypothetical protein